MGTKAVQYSLADAGLPLLDEHILAETPKALTKWYTLFDVCGPAVDRVLQEKGKEVDDNGRTIYVLETASGTVRESEGRLLATDTDVLVQRAEAAARAAMEQDGGWRTKAFTERCRDATRAIGWETGELEWRMSGDGGFDIASGIYRFSSFYGDHTFDEVWKSCGTFMSKARPGLRPSS